MSTILGSASPQAMPSKINPLQITESYVRHGKQFNKILDVVKIIGKPPRNLKPKKNWLADILRYCVWWYQ